MLQPMARQYPRLTGYITRAVQLWTGGLVLLYLGTLSLQRVPDGFDSPPPLRQTLPYIQVVDVQTRTVPYDRAAFGAGWAATAAGCSVREMVIVSQSNAPVAQCPIPHDAIIFDPYDSSVHSFADTTVDVDHLFPLSAAWDLGAAHWDARQRLAFANDPMNLIATQSHLNRDKSDSLPAHWLPPAQRHRCWYSRQLALVAAQYRLALTTQDVATMKRQCWMVGLVDNRLRSRKDRGENTSVFD